MLRSATRGVLGFVAGALVLAPLVGLATAASAQGFCNGLFNIEIVANAKPPLDDNYFGSDGDVYTVTLDVGAGTISGATAGLLNVSRVRFELDCATTGVVGCSDDPNNTIAYNGNLVTSADCTDSIGDPVSFGTTHMVGDTLPNTVVFETTGNPVQIPEGKSPLDSDACQITFEVKIQSTPPNDSSPDPVLEAAGYNALLSDAVCNNGLSSGSSQPASIALCRTDCALNDTQCEEFACDPSDPDPTFTFGDTCLAEPVNEGVLCTDVEDTATCTDSACVQGVCTPGQLPANEGTQCADVNDPATCTESACVAGVCTPGQIATNEGTQCADVNDPATCTESACVAGVCTPGQIATNEGTQCADVNDPATCTESACVAGVCTPGQIAVNEGQSCGETTDPATCTEPACLAGVCTAGQLADPAAQNQPCSETPDTATCTLAACVGTQCVAGQLADPAAQNQPCSETPDTATCTLAACVGTECVAGQLPDPAAQNQPCSEAPDTATCTLAACVGTECTAGQLPDPAAQNQPCSETPDTGTCTLAACVGTACLAGQLPDPAAQNQPCTETSDPGTCTLAACVGTACLAGQLPDPAAQNQPCSETADPEFCTQSACVGTECVAGQLPDNEGEECSPSTSPCLASACTSGECVESCEPDGKPECETTIGDFIWKDVNGDGLQDTESGIANVDLNLIECTNGQVVEASTTTNGSGFYSFTVPAVDENCVPTSRDLLVEVDAGNFSNGGALQNYSGSPQNVGPDDTVDSDCDPTTHQTACTPFPDDSTDLTVDCGFIPPPQGCRVTGGGNAKDLAFTHGGQVGSPCGCIGCFDGLSSVQGEWTHSRKKNDGRFHASQFSSLVCDLDSGEGPLPRPAPANKVCFAGKGMFAEGKGKRETPVAFRVEIEDRGEPGGGKNAGNQLDVYRMRMWLPAPGQQVEDLLDNICCLNPEPVGIGAPFIDDGGEIRQGNLQIHPSTPNTQRGICPPPQEVAACFQQAGVTQ
jgi:hypothetical protein